MRVNVPSTANKAQEGGYYFKPWCRKHGATWEKCNANPIAAISSMVGLLLDKLERTIPADLPEAERDRLKHQRMAAASQYDTRPLCCRLSDDERDMLLAEIIQTTGDRELDQLAAAGKPSEENEDCGNPYCPVHSATRRRH